MKKITKCSGVIIRDRAILMTRKKGTDVFISPGGKIQPGEDRIRCLCRELFEELSLSVNEDHIHFIGRFEGMAQFEEIHIENFVYRVDAIADMKASSEIEEIKWVRHRDLDGSVKIGSIFLDQVFPIFFEKGLID